MRRPHSLFLSPKGCIKNPGDTSVTSTVKAKARNLITTALCCWVESEDEDEDEDEGEGTLVLQSGNEEV